MAIVKSNAISHIHSRLWCLAWYMDHIHNMSLGTGESGPITVGELC